MTKNNVKVKIFNERQTGYEPEINMFLRDQYVRTIVREKRAQLLDIEI